MASPQAGILNYEGNANLAVGSSGDSAIADWGVLDTSGIVPAMQDLATRRNTVKTVEYNQKIKDRDKVFDQIANLQADLDKVLPEHRGLLTSQIDEIEKIYLDSPDILNNKEAYIKMNKALTKFNELNAYAKTNYVTTTQDILAASKIQDAEDRNKRMEHINGQRAKLKEDPYGLYDPYVKQQTFDIETMFKPVAATEKVEKEGADFMDTKKVYVDPNTILANWNRDYLEGNDKNLPNQVDEWVTSIATLKTPEEKKADFAAWNKKVDAANKYISDPSAKIKTVPVDEETGNPLLSSTFSKSDLAKAGYVAYRFNEGTTTAYNKGRADAAKVQSDIAKDQADIKLKGAQADAVAKNAESNRIKALANQGYYVAKTKQITDGSKPVAGTTDADNPFNQLITSVQVSDNGKMVINETMLPPGLKEILGGVGKDGKPVSLEPKDLGMFDKTTKLPVMGYSFKPLDVWYYKTDNGWVPYTKAELAQEAKNAKMPLDKMIKEFVANGAYQDGEVFGKNGKGTRLSAIQSARALNNKLTGKNEEDVIKDDEGNIPDDVNQ